MKYIFHAVKKVIVSAKYFTAWKKFTPYVLREHHSPTVNVVVFKSRLPTAAHFSDLLQALKLESHYHSKSIQSVPKIRC